MKTLAQKKSGTNAAAEPKTFVGGNYSGNYRAQRLKIRNTLDEPAVQAKLIVGEPDDEYEKEADRVADQVMRMPEPGIAEIPPASPVLPSIQRMCSECEEEMLQTKRDGTAAPTVTPDIASAVHSLKGKGQPLPKTERDFFEPRFGADFSGSSGICVLVIVNKC